jgi:hypothetical protein
MDFIERWFGMSPDGGSGGLEVALIVALIIVALVVLAAPLAGKFRFVARRSRHV